jgi:hypothetical protein
MTDVLRPPPRCAIDCGPDKLISRPKHAPEVIGEAMASGAVRADPLASTGQQGLGRGSPPPAGRRPDRSAELGVEEVTVESPRGDSVAVYRLILPTRGAAHR